MHSIFEFSIARLKVEGLPSDGVEDGPIGFVVYVCVCTLQFQYEKKTVLTSVISRIGTMSRRYYINF